MMKAKDYIESRLSELAKSYGRIGIRYKYEFLYEAHYVELDFSNIKNEDTKDAIYEIVDSITDEYYETFTQDSICFFEKGDLVLKVNSPTYSYKEDKPVSINFVDIGISPVTGVITSWRNTANFCNPSIDIDGSQMVSLGVDGANKFTYDYSLAA